MEQHKRTVFRNAAVLLVTAVVAAFLFGELTKPKFYNDNYWPLDVTYQGFYEMEKDSVDVIFLGSSHAISAFSPQELYDSCGIRSFNLSSEEQSLFVSYYWLKEAIRLQSPKAVVLDTVVVFPYMETPYNCTEPAVRKALDPMKWSNVKLEAVTELHKLDAQQTLASFVFPVIRYHARWNALEANDFRFWPPQNTSLKGYAVLSEDAMIEDFVPVRDEDCEPAGVSVRMMEYLKKIEDLCKEEGIELILVNTPYLEATNAAHRAMADHAEAAGVTYINFNEESVYEQLNFDFPHDMADAGHANTSGAIKLTDYIGTVLKEKGVPSEADAQYEESRAYAHRQIKNANLYRIDSFDEYWNSIDPSDYLIFVTARTKEAGELLSLNEEGPFAALLDDGNVEIYRSDEKSWRFKENIRYELHPGDAEASIKVYDLAYERTDGDLQIVLLDLEKGYVIDHSVFDASGNRVKASE